MPTQAPPSWPSCLLEVLQVSKQNPLFLQPIYLTWIFLVVSHPLLYLAPVLILAIKVLLLDLGHIVELMLPGIMLAYILGTFSVLVLR